ncbi:lipoprotein BA_5634 family protein [Bacillus thuringiensis]|uniref:lipoprotein BA_5634 family protein n=1 Tax=Bacillus thuringiensis TaxID=1428 RepID=UPI0022490447|nr:lipoprotein BA_5634 family protein [Bacillus thuringiensis]MED2787279.1 lipoprotein BA_5634 family protein [Bacillus thuringiensis]MED2827437.1 lipoprotein BA_5634 family protein [Bacillus thuringiensis]MED2833998.1 lipoprotein BA_5634 family protein [Bacillus thuringiensis]MED2848816.1 lipoprotein BA_5634 family protein [Bacillus thuringiensis]MED2857396.1 lipoprotein BA_5634 family protein [Bacillus thuringiensis]
MKKRIGLLIVASISITMLGACSLFGTKDSPANGLSIEVEQLNEQTRNSIIDSYKDITTSQDLYQLKEGTIDNNKLDIKLPTKFGDSMDTATSNLLFISRTTAEKMVKKGLILERDNNQGDISSDPVDSLPKSKKGETILFANKEYRDLKELTFDKKKMNVQYKGDAWLSPYRGGSNEILLIVDDTLFKEINGKEKTRQILSFNKSFGNLNLVNQGKAPELSKEIDKVNTALGTEEKGVVNFVNIKEK